jgi:hypothetical protein
MSKLQNFLLILIFVLSAYLHFYDLTKQEFIGDEASSMLLIDRMWDSIPLKDARFLAYPFLLYSEPYRAIFSGTLLHFIGPNQIILRLPSIIFGLFTICLLIWIFKREKISSWLIILSVASYAISPIIYTDRIAGGGAGARFFILLTGYLVWQSSKLNFKKNFKLSLYTWVAGILTMLDTFIIFPGILASFIKNRFQIDKKIIYHVAGIIIFLFLYFTAWAILPYYAHKLGYQHYLLNRGLFYYIARANGGISPGISLDSIKSLIDNTSLLFALWIIATSLFAIRIKKFFFIYLLSIFIWAAVILLNHSSSHIIVYAAFFFYQAVIITDYLIKRYPAVKFPLLVFIASIIIANALNLFTNYFTLYSSPLKLTINQKLICFDASVVRIYKAHGKPLTKPPCEAKITK